MTKYKYMNTNDENFSRYAEMSILREIAHQLKRIADKKENSKQ